MLAQCLLRARRVAAVDADDPVARLEASHRRTRDALALVEALGEAVALDASRTGVRDAASWLLRHFDVVWRHHRDDIQRHVVPLLAQGRDAGRGQRWQAQAADAASAWQAVRPVLQGLAQAPAQGPDSLAGIAPDALRARLAALAATQAACLRIEATEMMAPLARALDPIASAWMVVDMAHRRSRRLAS